MTVSIDNSCADDCFFFNNQEMHFTIILLFAFPLTLPAYQWQGQVEVIPGLMREELALPFIYETFVPAFIEFRRPILRPSDLSTEDILRRNCTSPEYTPNSPCPTAFYISEQFQTFANNFKDLQQPSDTDASNFFLKYAYGGAFDWKDLESSLHVANSMYSGNAQVREHISQITAQAPLHVHYNEKNSSTEFSSLDFSSIKNMTKGFYDQFWLQISSDRIDDALFSNAISLYQSLLNQKVLLEIVRWNRILEDCGNFKLPRFLVTERHLADVLIGIEHQVNLQDFDLTLGYDLNLGRYYQTRLTTCVLTETSIYVNLRVPILEKKVRRGDNGSYWEFFRVHPIPFLLPPEVSEKSNQNGSTSTQICRLNTKANEVYLFNTALGHVQASPCKSNEFCSIGRDWPHGLNDLCMSSVVESKVQEILDHCPMTCDTTSELHLDRFPLIEQVDGRTWVFTGRTDGVFVACDTNLYDWRFPSNDIGALKVDLLPSCRLVVGGTPTKTLRPHSGTTLLPVHWTVDKSLGPKVNIELDVDKEEIIGGRRFFIPGTPTTVTGNAGGIIVLWVFLVCVIILATAGFLYLFNETRKLSDDVRSFRGGAASAVYVSGYDFGGSRLITDHEATNNC